MKISTDSFVCTVCGYQIEVSSYWIKNAKKDIYCPACQSKDDWKKTSLVSIPEATKKAMDNELWKKLLIAQNPDKFSRGYFKLTKNYKKLYNLIDDLEQDKLTEREEEALTALKVVLGPQPERHIEELRE